MKINYVSIEKIKDMNRAIFKEFLLSFSYDVSNCFWLTAKIKFQELHLSRPVRRRSAANEGDRIFLAVRRDRPGHVRKSGPAFSTRTSSSSSASVHGLVRKAVPLIGSMLQRSASKYGGT
jgi:hypothetical protein